MYLKPKLSKFGPVLAAPGEVIKVLAKEKKATIYPSGASLLNAFGISTQIVMGSSYISNRRIQPFKVNNTKVEIRYSRAFENAAKKLTGLSATEKELSLKLWVVLEYMGEREALKAAPVLKRYWSQMSLRGKNKFEKTLNGKLNWAKAIIPMT